MCLHSLATSGRLSDVKTFTMRDLNRKPSVVLDVCDSEGAVRIRQKPHYRLSDLLAGTTPDNMHPETGWGPSRGKEILGDEGEK
jgi:antitoxin component of MazEF toxin-antitoxin module